MKVHVITKANEDYIIKTDPFNFFLACGDGHLIYNFKTLKAGQYIHTNYSQIAHWHIEK